MKRNYLFLLLFIHSVLCLSWAADTVRINEPADLAVNAISGASEIYALNVDDLTGEATEEGSPATIYVATRQTSVTDDNLYFLYSKSGYDPLNTTTNSATNAIMFPLKVTIGTTSKYLYSATSIGGTYYVSSVSSTTMANMSNSPLTFSVSPAAFCATYALSGTGTPSPCNDVTLATYNLKTYFFVSSTAYSTGQAIDLTAENNGVYFLVKISNRIHTTSNMVVTVTNIRKGDGRLVLEYSTTAQMGNFSKVKAFIHSAAPTTVNLPVGDTGNTGSVYSSDLSSSQEGELTINGLQNNTTYRISLFFVDKYNYASTLSVDVQETPTQIDELLKKNSCFLLTAGFGEDHYIIDYFRNFRDTVLLKNFFGKKFVQAYYELAPHYALLIYENEAIRSVIRGCAYVLYYAFTHIYAVILGIVLIPSLIFVSSTLRKIKITKA